MRRYLFRRLTADIGRPRTSIVCGPTLGMVLGVHFLCLLLAGTSACGRDELRPELIPGTEWIDFIDGQCFSISPDERWIAFMETDSIHWNSDPVSSHLVTMDLTTFEKTHHHLEDIPPRTFLGLPPWIAVEVAIEEANWSKGAFLVEIRSGGPIARWIAFLPRVAAARVAERPDSFECLDCPPPAVVKQLREKYDIPPLSPVSVAFRDGVPSTTFFRGRGAVMERVDEDGRISRIVEEKRMLRDIRVGALRVSPDERHLVFTLVTFLKSPVPLPTMNTEIYLLGLTTHRRQRVGGGDARVIRGASWSADSKRFYYARTNGESGPGRGHGVYMVRVNRD